MKTSHAPLGALKEIRFDEDDLSLFQVDDLQLKADAIRNSILPKLNLLVNHSILRVKQIYDIEVFEDSHISQSPNFRSRRASDVKVDYTWCVAALTGKRAKGKWNGLTRKDGQAVQIIPPEYGYVLSNSGLRLALFNQPSLKLSDKSWTKLIGFLAENEGIIQTLCHWSRITPILHMGEDCGPFKPLGARYRWMIEKKRFNVHRLFESHLLKPPIHTESITAFVNTFAYFYPVYDSLIQISKGTATRFDELIERLSSWWKANEPQPSRKASFPMDNGISEEDLLKAKQAAEQRTRVMPSIRWQVFQRDNWRCVSCGRSADDEIILHVDHIIPRSKGGADSLDNYQTLCSICNLGKSNKDDTDLRNKNSRNT